jgi:hypothetical protein
MTDIDAKSVIFGIVLVVIVLIVICVVRKFTTTSDAYGKLERTYLQQQAYNSKPETFLDRGARMLGNGFGYLAKEDTGVSAQAQKLVNKAAEVIESNASTVAENVTKAAENVNVPIYEATENEVDLTGDVAPTSGNPIETSPTEAFGGQRYTNDFNALTGQGVIQSTIAQQSKGTKTVSLSQQALAEKFGFNMK